jgi:hypothetical protein
MRRGNWITVVVVLATAIAAMAQLEKVRLGDEKFPVRGGSNDPVITAPITPDPTHDSRGTLDSIGTVYQAGNTYYDQQHNGTAGKMIGVDDMGFVHLVWMRGTTTDIANGPRHIYYNCWEPSSREWLFLSGGVPTGVVVDASTRAGYTCLATENSGWVYPGYHQIRSGDPNAHAAGAIDYQPSYGIFNGTWPSFLYENGVSLELIWPKIAVGRNSVIHMVSAENPADTSRGMYQRVYYSRGLPVLSEFGEGDSIAWQLVDGTRKFLEIDTVMDIAAVVAASKRSDRVAIAFPRPRIESLLDTNRNQINNDLHVIISEDGGLNWGEPLNITSFEYPDTNCVSGDTLVCDKDTFRVYTDCAAMFDRNDHLHLAFTTRLWYEVHGWIYAYRADHSDIWHWGETDNTISHLVRGSFGLTYTPEDTTINSNWVDCGAWQLMVQRPSFAEDSVTGYLYCSYQRYDTMQWAAAAYPSSSGTGQIPLAEAYVAVSTNGGNTWSEGTDVTSTIAPDSALAGQCKHERDITIADNVTYENSEGFLHMSYIFDGDGGTPLQNEGSVTLNPVRYQRIPINAIPTTPIDPYWNLNIHATVPITDVNRNAIPDVFTLYQNYPNPFNPVTNIQFDLTKNSKVTLKIYNTLGQDVATLFDGEALTAGAKVVTFDASHLASGVYVYRLEADGLMSARKMILMK